MKKILKWTIVGTFLAVIAAGGFGLWILFGSKTSNPNNYKTIGEIPEPWGYVRINGDDVAYTNYLRSLPLKERGAKVHSGYAATVECRAVCRRVYAVES